MEILQIYQGDRTFHNLKNVNIFLNTQQEERIIFIFTNVVTLSIHIIFC